VVCPKGLGVLYLKLASMGFRRMAVYRSAALAGVATNLFFGLLRAYVFVAVFEAAGRDTIGGYDLRQAVTYTALTQLLIAPIHIWGWNEVARTVRSGDIATDLAKPYHFFAFWLARDQGRALFQCLFRGLPILLLFPLFFPLHWPGSAGEAALGVLSLWLAVLLSFSWRFFVNLSAFWFVEAAGIDRFAYLTMTFLSGFVVPVAFFPDWLQAFVRWTPMPAMVNTPVEVYLGVVQGSSAWGALALQALWWALLTGLCLFAFRRGVRRLVVQGG